MEPSAGLAAGLAKLDSVEEVGILIPNIYLHLAPESPKITIIRPIQRSRRTSSLRT